ncbi:MAG: 5'-deoxynucleotidase [Eubacterium sp.]|nr:5'-deoxynucleotidase [Eubacterium sp.]
MNNFFGMLARMKHINRWGLMRNANKENIAEHSLEVAFIAHALAVIGNTYFGKDLDEKHIAVLGMYHDTPEIITGDMPTPIKYYAPEIRDSYKKVEEIAARQLLNELPEEMKPHYEDLFEEDMEGDYKYVKAADKLSAYIKCLQEEDMGNNDFKNAKDSLKKIIDDMQMEEVDYFIEHFLGSYNRTLDEIN